MSTTTENKRKALLVLALLPGELEFVQRIGRHADEALISYDLQITTLRRRLLEAIQAADSRRATFAVALFLQTMESLAQVAINGAGRQSLAALETLPGPQTRHFIPSLGQSFQQTLWIEDLRHFITSAQRHALQSVNETGLSLPEALNTYLSAGKLGQFRKALDFAVMSTQARQIQSAGTGIFSSKVAVPVLDSHTTRLCRDRMAWQVRAWEEKFVDPETGAAWLFSPFVGAGLPRHEAFHFCRTITLPRA